MGNQLGTGRVPEQQLDFDALFVDGESWDDAQKHGSFLSKVQRCLLEPSFVAALQMDPGEEQRSVDSKEKTQVFDRMISAGAFDSHDLLALLKPRYQEALSSTLHTPPYAATLAKRVHLLRHLQERVSSYRSAAQRPLVKQQRAPPPPSTEESSQVQLTYSMNRVCLVSLKAIVEWGKASGSMEYVRLPLRELQRMAMSFQPLCFFEHVSLPVCPPEAAVDLEPTSAFASSTDSNRTPDKALDDKSNSYWCSKKRPGAAHWGVRLREPEEISAVTVSWQQTFNSVFAPAQVTVQVSHDGDTFVDVAKLDMEDLTLQQASAPVRIPASAERVMAVRLHMTGCARFNDQGCYALKSVAIHHTRASPEFLDIRDVIDQLLGWLVSVTDIPELYGTSLTAIERVACASGLLSCVLQFVFCLLQPLTGPSSEALTVEPMLVETTRHMLKCVEEEDAAAKQKMAQAVSSPMAPVVNAAFDPYEMSSTGLTLSDDNVHVRCHTASHSHVYLTCGFKEGRWAWEFLIAEDITNDESICIGAGIKPVTSSSYNSSPNLLMYRCYNGNLYRKGGQIAGVSKERVHPNDVVRVELDHDAHTLSVRINGDKDQGVCFTDVVGEVFPAVAFYGANRAVRLLAVECAGSAGPGVRYHLPTDPFKRKKWEGAMASGLRHGYGKLTYTHTASHWVGLWKQDKQHGLQAWVVVEPTTGKPNLAETVIYVFECDVKKRVATEKDVAAAVRDWDGWVCAGCSFVSRRASDLCVLCGAVKTVQEKAVEGEEKVDERLHSREACAAAIMTRLSQLGALYNSAVGEGSDEMGGVGARSVASSKDVTLPFVSEPRIEVFKLLHELIWRFEDLDNEEHSRLIIAGLRLVRTNFDRLVASHIDPRDMGIETISPGSDAPSPSTPATSRKELTGSLDLLSLPSPSQPSSSAPDNPNTLYPLRESLERLMMATGSRAARDIGQAAAEALAAGMEILYPDAQIRCSLLCHLLRSHTELPCGGPSAAGQSILLDRLLKRFGTNDGVVALLPINDSRLRHPANLSGVENDEQSQLLLEYLFRALHLEKSRELDDLVHLRSGRLFHSGATSSITPGMAARKLRGQSVEGDDGRTSFAESTSVLLGAYLRQLLSIAGASVSTNEGNADCRPMGGVEDASSGPEARMLVAFGLMLLKHCQKLLWTVSNHISSGSLSTSQAEAFLQSTVLFQLLPLFATASSLLSDQLWFASKLVPHIVRVIRSLDEFNGMLPEVLEAEKELRLQERAMTHGRWVSKKRNEVPNAAFDTREHSEDVSIEDNGKLFRSTSSSNQHALVNVGFKTGKAAWEFKLEADSSNDECSALGAAVKPLLNSSYESCPNMWMRRSYNGQLYHGTSAGYGAMSKVHPGDVVRVEVDLDAHTMSFKKNGEDEGVAFTDIEGEVFPAVCTYRSGIEVRLLQVEYWEGTGGTGVHTQSPLSLSFDSCFSPSYVRVDEYDNSVAHVDKERDEKWATAVAVRGLSSCRHVWEFCIRRCSKAMIAVGVCTNPNAAVAEYQLGMQRGSWAWRVDGTLWAHGRLVSASYGTIKTQHLLTDGDVITVTLDVQAQTLAFAVNGRDLGLAFGPPGSGAESEVPVAAVDAVTRRAFFPAVALHNYNDRVRMRPSGTMGTLALPWLLDLESTLMSVGSRLSATVTAGPCFSQDELKLGKWLKSPLFALGLERKSQVETQAWSTSARSDRTMSLLAEGGGEGGDDLDESKSSESDILESLSLLEGWDLIGEDERVLGSPDKRRRMGVAKTMSPLHSADSDDEDVFDDFQTSLQGDSRRDMNSFFQSILPPPPIGGGVDFDDDTPFTPSRELQLLHKWVDPHGSGRLTRRLTQSYPIVAFCEAYCLAAMLKVTGLWVEAARVIEQSGERGRPAPAVSSEARMVGKKLQELRMALVKRHQKMKEEQHEGDGFGLGDPRGPPSLFRTDSFGLLSRQNSTASLTDTSAEPVMREGASLSLSNTAELDFSHGAALLDGDRSGYNSGIRTPTMDDMRMLELRRRVSVGPHVLGFLQVCSRLLEKARFLLELNSAPGAVGGPQPPSPEDAPSLSEQVLQAAGDFLLDRSTVSVAQLRAVFSRRLARAMCRRYGLRCFRALVSASTHSSVQVHAVMHLKSALSAELLLGSGRQESGGGGGDGSSQDKGVLSVHGNHYMRGLEGCQPATVKQVQQDFAALYRFLLTLLKRALTDKNVTLACCVLAAWALDFEPADAKFLSEVKILSSLRSLLSLSRLSRCISAGIVITDTQGLHWGAWPIDDVRTGLAQGRITKRIVMEHMRSAPMRVLPRSWWLRFGLTPEATADLDVVTARLRIGDVVMLYESMLKSVSEVRQREKTRAAEADRKAREEARRKKGIKYTYIVTATNGVGVRQLPDTRAERTGHSYKQHEVVEASYRLTLSNRQTYIKLVEGGWVFDVGVRGSYQNKPIMRCIATEDFVAETEAEREARAAAGRLLPVPRAFKLADEPYEIIADGTTVYYKDPNGEHVAVVRATASIPRCAPGPQAATGPFGRKPLLSSHGATSYYEVTIHSVGARREICVGLWDGDNDDTVDGPVGEAPHTYGLHVKDWAIWTSGERLFCGKDRLLEGPSRNTAARSWQGVRSVVLGNRSRDAGHPESECRLPDAALRELLDKVERCRVEDMREEKVAAATLPDVQQTVLATATSLADSYQSSRASSQGEPTSEQVEDEITGGQSPEAVSPDRQRQAQRRQSADFWAEEEGQVEVKQGIDAAEAADVWFEAEGLPATLADLFIEDSEADAKPSRSGNGSRQKKHRHGRASPAEAVGDTQRRSPLRNRRWEVAAEAKEDVKLEVSRSRDLSPTVATVASSHEDGVRDDEDPLDLFTPVRDGDVVGVGVDHAKQQIFFTRNGRRLRATIDVNMGQERDLVPIVSLRSHCEVVEVNMGPKFLYTGRELQREVKMFVQIPPPLSTCLPPPHSTRSRARDGSSTPRTHHLGLRLPSPLPIQPSTLFAPFSPTPSEVTQRSELTQRSSLWRQQPALSPRLTERHTPFEHSTKDDEDLTSKENDFAYALSVPEMDALHGTAWPLFQLLLVQGVEFSLIKPAVGFAADIASSVSTRGSDRASPFRSMLDAMDPTRAARHLYHSSLDLVIEQLKLCADVLMGHRAPEDPSTCGGVEPLKVEALAFRYLLQLYTLADHLPLQEHTKPTRFLCCLLALLVCGSPRIQRLSMRVLRATLTYTQPSVVDEALTKCFRQQGYGAPPTFLKWMLDRMSVSLGRATGMAPSETGESAYAVPFKRGAFASSTGCGAGHAHLALVCEEACLLRALWSHPVWHDEITGTITSAFRRGAEAMRQTLDRPETTREVLSTLAALFVLSDMDMVRVGGILERRATGDRSVTSQYAVVEYKRGAWAVNVVDLVSKDQSLSAADPAATESPISLPVSSIASGEVMPVPEVSTPRLSDDACRVLLQQLLQLAVSCGRSPSPLHCDRKDVVIWSRVRTLTVCGLRTLLAQFRFTWSEPQLVPQISKLLFDLALAPVPLPSCPPTSRIESKLQVLQERMYECASQGHALLSCPEPSHLASALRLEGEEDTRLYRVVLKEGAVVRSGISIDTSDRVKVLKMGTVVEVLEQCAAPPEGITRLRIADGWISERCHGGSEELIVERVSKALVDSMPQQGPRAPPLPFDLEALRDKNIRHKLHDGPLRLSLQPCPEGGVWDCDHCSVNFFNNEPAFTAALPTRTYSLCIPCFCSDPKAVSYVRSRSRTASTEPSDAASPKSESSGNVHSSMPPRLDVADEKATPSGPVTPSGASSVSDSHVTSLAVMQLSEMGFREDDARRALHAALPASGALTMEGLEPVLQQAIDFLTSGTLPPVVVRMDEDEEPPPLDHDLAEEQDGTDEGYDDDVSRPLMLPQLDHDVPYSVAESKDDDAFGGGGSPYRRTHAHSPTHDHGYAWKKTPVEEMGADPAVPGSWDVRDTSKAEKVHRLSRATGCPRSVCRCALELCAGDGDAALRWIERHGMHYLPDQGRETSFYPSVFVSLGFRGNVVTGGSGELGIAGTDDMAVPHDGVHMEHENGEDGTAVMHKLSARMGSEGEETLLYEGASAKAPGDGWERCEERELAFEEAILENMEVERTSRLHKVIVALVCTRCRYLEFPGCSQHSQLLSVRKPNGHGKCARCSCATDLHSPWDKGCRVCRKPTMKYFWAITIRETQMLLRAFPSQSRTAYDDTCETYVQHCPECNVVGFAGLPGQTPVLCTRTKAGLYTPGAFHPTCANDSLSPETWYPHLSHVGSCSRAGQPVDPVLVRVSFSEAKYLYKTAANVDTYARYVVRARGVGDGTLVAVTEDEGPVDMLLGRLGTIRTVPPLAAAAVMSSEDVVEEGEEERPVGVEITVEMFDGERGFAVPETVPTSHARIVTQMYGHELQADTALGTLQHLAAETDGMVATRLAREALVLMMSHWPPQHPPTLPALGLRTWQPFIHLFKLVGLTERAFEPSVAGPESGACSSIFPGAEAVHASTLAERASAPGARGTAAPWCVRPASLAGTLKRQVALWLRSMSQYQDTTLFKALLADSLHNLHSMALGQALSPSLSPNVLQYTDNTTSYPAPASLRLAGRSMSYVHEPAAVSGPTVRQSLHPYFAPAAYGEEIRLSGAQSLRVTLDPRCAFGGERGGGADASLCFWRSEKAARSGAKPIKRWPAADDARSTEAHGTAASMSFVMPDTDRLFYTFTANDSQSRHLPRRLELEVTKFCREDVTVDDNNVVKCHAGFPTLTTKDVVLTSAKWYYEVHIIKAGLAQLGWGDALFTGNSMKGEGVGDDLHSWGLDGHRVYKWHGGGVKWGREWQDGDTIGFAADLDKRTFSFSFNGSWEAPMGLAFEDVTFVEGLRPCLTLNKSCNFRVNFGEEPFKHTPPTGHRGVFFAPRDHVLRKSFWGYRFEVAPCLGIQTRFVSDFKPLWKSSNAPHGPSSQSGDILSIWRPKVLPGCAMLGDVAVSGLVKPEITLLVVDDDSPLLAYPTGYTRVMTLDTRSTESSGCLWRPIPPEGFVAIGDVFSSGFTEPPLSLVRCLRQDALEPAPLYRRVRVWREAKGGVVSARDGPRQPSATLWAVGNQCHSFMIAEGYTTPMTDGFPLRGWRIRGAMPGAMNQAWHAETEAQAQPSMDWALWVLHCFLENSTDTQLTADTRSDRGTDLLRGGILTGHATYEALVRCVVDSHCTDRARSPAASLLTRLLRTRRTYAQLLSPQPGELPGSVRALGRVTKELFKFCRERVQSSTRLFLQRDLQQIIELITTINWVSPQTLAVHHGFVAGSPRGRTSHGPPSFMLPPRSARRALTPTPSAAPDTAHTHTHAHMHVKTTGPGKLLAQLKRAAKGERMSDAEAISDLMSLAEFFGESSAPLSLSTTVNKAPHIPFCITTVRAWLETVGSSAVVESVHPWVGLHAESGEIVLDGAGTLEVIFDRRCNLGPSGMITLIGQDANSDTITTINWETGEGSNVWTGSSSHRGDFEARVIFRGPRLRWRVDVDAGGVETSEGAVWGYAFTAVGRTFTPGTKLRRVMKALENSEMTGSFARWSAEYDVAIVEWLNSQADVPGKDALGVSPFDFRHGPTDVSGAVTLQLGTLPISAIYHRIILIQGFNRAISQVLPLLDVSSGCRHSLGHKLRGLSYLIFRDIKINLIDAGKSKTQGGGGNALTITLDNFAASRSMEAEEKDIRASRCIFVQAFRALHHKDTKLLRSCWDGDRVFQVTFRGESGSDVGGVFREGMSRVVEDLFSDTINLLIPCPNAQHGLPTNVDKFLPNPKLSACPLALDMFEFVGKLMGISLRANLCLPFQFPSLVWKQLLGQELGVKDMESVDTLTCKLLESVRSCVSAEDFDEKYGNSLTFVCTGWDGSEMELFPGGASEYVVYDTRDQYCHLLLDYRLHEFDQQVAAMGRGLFALVPRTTLLLLTWREFEVLVCGTPSFDMEFWRRHTTYSGYTEEDVTIQLFWKVMQSLSQEEQSGFVRFAWGRSRLPPKHAWFKDMQISRRNTGDDSLPASHTCFFSIELPPYKTEATMRKGLLTAIHFGMVGILNT